MKNNTVQMKCLLHILSFPLFAALISCQGVIEPEVGRMQAGMVELSVAPVSMGRHIVNTRSTDKTPEEVEIYNLHVFFFDHDSGDYLRSSGSSTTDEGKSYRYLDGGESTLLIDASQFEDASNVDIFVLANLAEGTFSDTDGDGLPDEIADRAAMEAYRYTPYRENNKGSLGRYPDTGLPMSGRSLLPQDFTGGGGQVISIQLKSLMARVDFNLSLNPPAEDVEDGYPVLHISGIQLCNMPSGAFVIPQDGQTDESVLDPDAVPVTINLTPGSGNNSYSFSFYMFESFREATGTIDAGIPEEYQQRFKPTVAAEDAAYVYLIGRYTDKNAYTSNITYTLYLGENAVDDFNITRNCKYVNNVSVRGITAVNHPDAPDGSVVGLDTRVTVSREENDYYYTILRERNHDAHFNVTPMDVYLPGRGSLVFEVPAEAQDWIWMDPIQREAESEGDGKAAYFYTDMQDWLREKHNGQDFTAKYTMTNTGTGLKVERIYFYLDENSSLGDREADIKINFESADGTVSSQTLTLGQRGLMTSTIQDGPDTKIVYMEQYEEYLNYYDPLASYNSSERYEDGLPWGNNSEIGSDKGAVLGVSRGTYCSQNTTMGDVFTPIIAEHNGQEIMTLDDTPESAAAYCLNKNKRNRDGTVVDVIWYLPGIRELEQTLLHNYTVSSDFQENYYWSSAAGEEEGFTLSWWGNTYNEDIHRARATRVRHYVGGQSNPDAPDNVDWEGEYAYEKSGVNEAGWQERSTINRVRCFRIIDGVTE